MVFTSIYKISIYRDGSDISMSSFIVDVNLIELVGHNIIALDGHNIIFPTEIYLAIEKVN